jgi:AmmeMemoRadiSam system protein B
MTHSEFSAPVRPKLRRLEISRVHQDDSEYFLFHDRAGVAPDVALSVEMGPILVLMDGTHDLETLLAHARRIDDQISLQWLQGFIDELDEHFLLESPRYEAQKREHEKSFVDEPVRPAALAGLSYAAEPDVLRRDLNLKLAQGEKRLPPRAYDVSNVRGIVTPHIDFGRGGHTEAASYLPLVENVRATSRAFDTLIVLGIAHAGVEYPFCLAPKSFQTPFGILNCDDEICRDLEARLGPQLTREQYVHKDEHSIEFSAVFAGFWPELANAKIVPILCGGFWESLRAGALPEDAEPEVAAFVDALREVVREHEARGRKIGFVASVDGAHVGTQFGDETKITPARLKQIEDADRAWCTAIEAGDRAAFHAHFAHDGNRFNVDAHPAVYTLMAAFPTLRGQLLDYDQAFNARANIVVSFASLALFEG